MHVHDLEMFKFAQGFNLSHRIDKLSFGQEYPGLVNPLDGVFKNGGGPDIDISTLLFIIFSWLTMQM
jgi:hypothetical protein